MLLPFDQIERLLSRWDHGAWVCYITGIETVWTVFRVCYDSGITQSALWGVELARCLDWSLKVWPFDSGLLLTYISRLHKVAGLGCRVWAWGLGFSSTRHCPILAQQERRGPRNWPLTQPVPIKPIIPYPGDINFARDYGAHSWKPPEKPSQSLARDNRSPQKPQSAHSLHSIGLRVWSCWVFGN